MLKEGESLGIPNYGPWYFEIAPNQNKSEEVLKTHAFINSTIESDRIAEFQGQKSVKFINYGRTQLVYVLTVNNSRQYTLLVNQPATEFGTGKQEFENLSLLHKNNNKNVIEPLWYFSNGEKELYVTPYNYQARCIGIETKDWGMWVPEPQYNFKEFTDKERKIVNSSMVAMLIELYDEKNGLALSGCRLDGGDFMLEKDSESEQISYENIFKRIKLIAARKLIPIEFDKYLDRIRLELSGKENKEPNIVVGKKIKNPLLDEEIEEGIKLGLQYKKEQRKEDFCI